MTGGGNAGICRSTEGLNLSEVPLLRDDQRSKPQGPELVLSLASFSRRYESTFTVDPYGPFGVGVYTSQYSFSRCRRIGDRLFMARTKSNNEGLCTRGNLPRRVSAALREGHRKNNCFRRHHHPTWAFQSLGNVQRFLTSRSPDVRGIPSHPGGFFF
ncbi:hypothetical protein BDV26DRAFT_255367, partial [Aspergillus bertholletiae]